MRSALTRTDRYSRGAIWFHWIIALLVIVNLAIGLLHESLFEGVKGVIPLHKSLGLTVLVLTVARIAWRFGHRPPPHPPTMIAWERLAANAAHFLLYALMLALPLTGWAMSSGGPTPRPLTWFGLFNVPYLPVSAAAGDAAHNAHGLLGWVMLALIVLHIGAALRHHFILHDAILARLVPGLRARD